MMDKAAEEAKVGAMLGYVTDLSDYALTIDNNVKKLPEIFQSGVASGSIDYLMNHTKDMKETIDGLPGQINGLYGIIDQVYKEEHPDQVQEIESTYKEKEESTDEIESSTDTKDSQEDSSETKNDTPSYHIGGDGSMYVVINQRGN